jgi:alkanesulfonate monooxygenase SsuD/methylene tetrahydromethanopterin reductase-like flavin-dependent oxidoreductase (luciferase family)
LRAEAEVAAAGGGPHRAQLAVGRILQGESVPDDELFEALSEQDSLIVGSPETCRKKLRAYAELGIDRMMAFHQVNALSHETVLKSIRLIGELIPEFAG